MSEVFKTGVLIKKSRNRGALSLLDNWQERKITLLFNQVTYGPIDGPTKDGIAIGKTTRVEPCDSSVGAGKSFRITTGAEELVLCCPDEFIRDEWVKAILTIANDPTPNDKTDDRARLASEMSKLSVEQEAKKKADADEAAAAAAKALAMESDAARKVREAADAAAALLSSKNAAEVEAKKKMHAALQSPVECQKKLSTESSYHTRWIWVSVKEKEFHWAKSAEDVTKSKCINIMTHIKSIKANAMPDVLEPNFTIELNEQLPENVFTTKLFSSALPTHIHITMADASKNLGFVNMINEIKNPPPPPSVAAVGMAAMGAVAGAMGLSTPSMGSMGLGMPSSGSMLRSAGVPSDAVRAGQAVANATK